MFECPGCGGYNVRKLYDDDGDLIFLQCRNCSEAFNVPDDDDGTDGNGDDVPNGRH